MDANLPPVKLSKLRDIGFTLWDPIGIRFPGEKWDHQPWADEYDNYLLEALSRLRRGDAQATVVEFLIGIVTEHMGLTEMPTTRPRAVATVGAINDYAQSLKP